MERETGIEPATNGLGSRDSTTELLPPVMAITAEIVTSCAAHRICPILALRRQNDQMYWLLEPRWDIFRTFKVPPVSSTFPMSR
jgi:hypothetical protein